MKIIFTLIKVVLLPVTFPYYILKWLLSGSSSASSGSSSAGSNSSKTGQKNAEAFILPDVSIDPKRSSDFEIIKVFQDGGRRAIRVKYKDLTRNTTSEVIVDRPSAQNGPLRIKWK